MKQTNLLNRLFYPACLLLGFIFIYASYDKLLNLAPFAQAIYNYRLFPVEFINLIAIILPWLELVIGVSLVLKRFTQGAALIATILNIIFLIALSSALIRGLDISCGCFTLDAEAGKIGIIRILEDLFFLGLSVFILLWYPKSIKYS